MNEFQIPTPRVTLGIAAVAMTAITIGLLVVLPSKMKGESDTFLTLAAPNIRPGSTETVITLTCIEVTGTRDPKTVFHPVHNIPATRRDATIL